MNLKKNNIIQELNQGIITAFVDQANVTNLAFKPEFIYNDTDKKHKILTTLERELLNCDSFSISVAFITQSGIEPLLQTLQVLEQKGVPGKILTTDYLTFSEPAALKTLDSLNNITLKMYQAESGPGFHTKGYIFKSDGLYRIIIGSANLTQKALTINHEWNAKIISMEDGEIAKKVQNEFELLWNSKKALPFDVFYKDYLTKYQTTKKQRELARQTEIVDFNTYKLEPNSMQVSFIQRLKELAESGEDKGLLISATGTGKTYASAFGVRDALQTNGKVLFIVHRKQILRQAMESYQKVFNGRKTMALLTGEDQDYNKIMHADFVFSMITMISKEEVKKRFQPNEFSAIVIDEVHHAAAPSYQSVMDYFKPDFWLGMTATPDRSDSGNIYELFNHNIVYEIRLQQALENDLLCPFHYFGIKDIAFDETENGDDLMKKLEQGDTRVFSCLTSDERVKHVMEQANYYGYSGNRVKGLIFCSSISEAEVLATKFNEKGWKTRALSGDDPEDVRSDTIDRLINDSREDYLDYILTVNIFNEGVDIPEINQVVMLRPTESAIVFIQQLGRGLRKNEEKEFVVVLDFIGNYSNNFLIPIALSGDRTYNKDNMRKYLMEGANIIPGCSTIHFDEISKQQIFDAIDKSTTPLAFLKEKYQNLKYRLGRMPTMEEFYKFGEVDPMLFVDYRSTSYYDFVIRYDKDSPLEEFTEKQIKTIDYISTQIANGKRPHELVIMQQLIDDQRVDFTSTAERLSAYSIKLNRNDFESALAVIDKSFLNKDSDKIKYSQVELLTQAGNEEEQVLKSSDYIKDLQAVTKRDRQFIDAIKDVIRYGIAKYEEEYCNIDESNLQLYKKYSRRDVCRLLNWGKDEGSTIYGYRIKHGTCPIFVTYEKKNDISESTKYEDQFVDSHVFSWMTRNRVKLDSIESQELIHYRENGLMIYLFVKKSDDEGTDFYYMGPVEPIEYTEKTIENDKGKSLPIMNFKMKLKYPVRNDIYDYITKERDKNGK